jgi:hypothetical protein
MVWEVFAPATFGMHSPRGDIPGFDERLEVYYTIERRDAGIRAIGLEDEFKELQSMGIEHTLI